LREGKPKVVISTTPRNTEQLKKIKANSKTYLTRGSTYENKANLSEVFIDEVIKPYEGTRIGRQELEAEIIEDVEGALWNYLLIDSNRINKKDLPELIYIVVGVDPAGSSTGDEIGIVGVHLCMDHLINGLLRQLDYINFLARMKWLLKLIMAVKWQLIQLELAIKISK
jgi:phage terminase large subunit-like protein